MKDFLIRPMEIADLASIKAFTDRAIGTNYYSLEELKEVFRRSIENKKMCSFVLTDKKNEIHGIRFTYPPGNWSHGKGRGLSQHLWQTNLQDTAYFQSLFVDPALGGKGWGQKLSEHSLKVLSEIGAKAVVCHSWKESPFNSSFKYLSKLGFRLVTEHPLYWKEVDYVCTRCGKPCLCTAQEMILYLNSSSNKEES